MPEDQRIPRFLKRRRILRHTAVFFLILILLSIVLDHAGAFGQSGTGAGRFDHKSAYVTRAIAGDTICVRLSNDARETTVHLLGVDAPDLPASHWAENAAKYPSARTVGRPVTPRLE